MKAFWATAVTVFFSAAVACSSTTVVNNSDGGGGGGGDGGGGGKDGSSSTSTEDLDSEQENMACPSNSTRLSGTASVGATCAVADDCKPTCCSCTTGVNHWLAAACENKKCADTATTCAKTATPAYCQ